jgi:hypothetical protein
LSSRETALFPISLSNQAFSSENVLPLLLGLFERYHKVMFLVADRLQIYNKALRVNQGTELPKLIKDFEEDQHYLEQRKRWLERLTSALGQPANSEHWCVAGSEEFADDHCFKIFRNVMLAYYALEDFRRDVDDAAHSHALLRGNGHQASRIEPLSRGYILEEIAISIRVHVIGGIRDEFYIGDQALPVLRLYHGCYGIWPEELAQVEVSSVRSRFYGLSKQGALSDWEQVIPTTY